MCKKRMRLIATATLVLIAIGVLLVSHSPIQAAVVVVVMEAVVFMAAEDSTVAAIMVAAIMVAAIMVAATVVAGMAAMRTAGTAVGSTADWVTASFSRRFPGTTTRTCGTACPTTMPTTIIISGTITPPSMRLCSPRPVSLIKCRRRRRRHVNYSSIPKRVNRTSNSRVIARSAIAGQ